MEYAPDGAPVLRALAPPNDGEREAVPPRLRSGTVDWLSAMAKLARTVARTGRCDGEAATFDGRRRVDISARTEGLDRLPAQAGFAGGEALRCGLESRLVAGRRTEEDPAEAARPHRATAWMARVGAAPIPLPVSIEVPSRWFGTLKVVLVSLDPAVPRAPGQQAFQQRR
jgi:hypothetical protein